jgi:hypothetical protein
MKLPPHVLLPLRVVALLALAACGADADVECVIVPCALSLALRITVSNAASGATVPNVTFESVGQMSGTGGCGGTPTTCSIPGGPGTYTVTIRAPGFQSVTRSVEVTGTEAGKCNCASANTAHLEVALVAN